MALSERERASPEQMARSTALSHRTAGQAQALPYARDGTPNEQIGRWVRVSSNTVYRWRKEFPVRGVEGAGVIADGWGRRPWPPEGAVAAVALVTMTEMPQDTSTDWTTRTLVARLGIGKDSVARIWRDDSLKP
jgi:hypothetical protein